MKDSKYAVFVAIGIEVIVIILIASYAGKYLDEHKNWGGYGVIALPMIGLIGWLIQVIAMVNKISKDDESSQ